MFLLDTNVVCELRRPRPHGAVLAWMRATDDADLHLSAVTLGELQAGIELTRAQNPDKAAKLQGWLDAVEAQYAVLPMDGRTFREWARLMHERSDTLYEDAMIAATARVLGLTVVTRKVTDFRVFDATLLDPFEAVRKQQRDEAMGRDRHIVLMCRFLAPKSTCSGVTSIGWSCRTIRLNSGCCAKCHPTPRRPT